MPLLYIDEPVKSVVAKNSAIHGTMGRWRVGRIVTRWQGDKVMG